MAYHEKMVVCIKCDEKVLREFDGNTILLPFGNEYQIAIKNLESRPARLKIWIDGEDVLSGNGIIVPAGREHELSGFMNSGGRVTNSFRFIQKTEQIVDHRGDRIDDGILKIEWQFEKQQPIKIDVYENHYHNDWDHIHYYPKPYWPFNPNPWVTYTTNTNDSNLRGSLSNSTGTINLNTGRVVSSHYKGIMGESGHEMVMPISPAPDEGITTKGRELDQQYHIGYIGQLEPNKHTMIIRLKGTSKIAGERVMAPVEVKTKITCPTCGMVAKSGMRYCSNCGTNIIQV